MKYNKASKSLSVAPKNPVFHPRNFSPTLNLRSKPRKAMNPSDSYESLNLPLNANKEAVLKIRNLLRSKFGRTKDLKQLFSQWDFEGIGVVRPEDVLKVLSGLHAEAALADVQSLIAAVTQTKLGALTYPDFCKLLQIKQSPADLNSYLKKHMIQHASVVMPNNGYRLKKIQNILKYYLNVNQEALSAEFSKRDKSRNGRLTFAQFVQVMNAMGIPYHTVNGLNLKILFYDFGADIYGLDYLKFLERISLCRPFQLDDESEKPLFVDKKSLTIHQFSDIASQPGQIRSLLKVVLQSKDMLLKELIERFGVKVSRNSLKMYALTKGNLAGDDVEPFLDVFSFDSKGLTPITGVANWVFERSKEDLSIRRVLLPRLELSRSSHAERLRQLLLGLKNQVGFAKLPTKDGLFSKEDVKRALLEAKVEHDEDSFRKVFKGMAAKIGLGDFEVHVEKLLKSLEGKQYMKPIRTGK